MRQGYQEFISIFLKNDAEFDLIKPYMSIFVAYCRTELNIIKQPIHFHCLNANDTFYVFI